ncbi:hypothetical protein CRUP_035882 [Coryphaenoides rupestris]|nr:hypothetical protein CRUP_035882 [Coryphaenoides rupestris]
MVSRRHRSLREAVSGGPEGPGVRRRSPGLRKDVVLDSSPLQEWSDSSGHRLEPSFRNPGDRLRTPGPSDRLCSPGPSGPPDTASLRLLCRLQSRVRHLRAENQRDATPVAQLRQQPASDLSGSYLETIQHLS